METQNPNINKFSWRRVFNFGMLYKSAISNHIIILIMILILAYLCLLPIREFQTESNFAFYSLMSVIVSYCIFTGPLIFSRRDDSIITQLPATVSEKTAFYIIYSLIVVPIFVQLIWETFNSIGGLVFYNGNLESAVRQMISMKFGFDITTKMIVFTIINSVCSTTAVIMTVLIAVIRTKKHRFIIGLLTPLFVLLVIGVVGGIYGIYSAFTNLTPENPTLPTHYQDKILNALSEMNTFALIVDIILVTYSVIIGYKIYQYNKKHQVA